jgi:hypothetical protein
LSSLTSLLTCDGSENPNVDVLVLAETHIQDSPTERHPNIFGYNCHSRRYKSNSGGLAIYTANHLVAQVRPQLDFTMQDSPTAALWMAYRPFKRSDTVILLAAVYIHPAESPDVIKRLLDSLRKVIDDHPQHTVLIAGDFNKRHPRWGDVVTSPSARAIVDMLDATAADTLNQYYIPGRPTRVATGESTGSIIDLIIANRPRHIDSLRVADDYGLNSDHFPLELVLTRSSSDPLTDMSAPLLSAHRLPDKVARFVNNLRLTGEFLLHILHVRGLPRY